MINAYLTSDIFEELMINIESLSLIRTCHSMSLDIDYHKLSLTQQSRVLSFTQTACYLHLDEPRHWVPVRNMFTIVWPGGYYKSLHNSTRGTPQTVQFANIRKMSCVKWQGLPIVYVYASTHAWHVMPIDCIVSSDKSTCLTAKFGSFCLFRPHGSGRKLAKCDQFFCPKSDFFDFCNPCFFYQTFTNDVDFADNVKERQRQSLGYGYGYAEFNLWPQFVHCSLDWKIIHIGVLGIKVTTISWLHWSPVSGYNTTVCDNNLNKVERDCMYTHVFRIQHLPWARLHIKPTTTQNLQLSFFMTKCFNWERFSPRVPKGLKARSAVLM